jgi:hypothetical protein
LSQEDKTLRAAVASPFISYGVSELDKKSFINYISINMGWIPPRVVEDLIRLAFLNGLIEEIDGRIRLAIDPKSVSMRDFDPKTIEDSLKGSRTVLEMLSLVSDPYESSAAFRELKARYGEHLHDEALMLMVLRKRDIEYRTKETILKKP